MAANPPRHNTRQPWISYSKPPGIFGSNQEISYLISRPLNTISCVGTEVAQFIPDPQPQTSKWRCCIIKRRILVIDDDLSVCQSIQEAMQDDYTDVCYTMSVSEALDAFAAYDYCLIIVGLRLSETDGIEMLHIIRQAKTTPILLLAKKLIESEKVPLFHAGVNAVLEKPIEMSVCVAQANSLIQLYMEQTKEWTYHPLIFGTELIIDPTYRQVTVDGKHLVLTRKEFDLLLCLARHPGQVWSRTQLYSQVWNDDLGISGENAVKSHIGNLRRKLAGMGKDYIQTSWGVGYKFVPPAGNNKNKAT